MQPQATNDAEILALQALAATLSDERRARRFLDLSGIDTDTLRGSAGDRSLLAAMLKFLEAHEPDLISVAAEIGTPPDRLVAARRALEE